MVDHLNVSYLYKKCGVYYFSKRVPNDLKSHYKTNRIVIWRNLDLGSEDA